MRRSITTILLIIAAAYVSGISSSSVDHEKLRGSDVVGSSKRNPLTIDARGTITDLNNEYHDADTTMDNQRLLKKVKPTRKPTRRPTKKPVTAKPTTSPCISFSIYDAIDADIANLKASFPDTLSQNLFLGGIVRLVAHDFMDFDTTNTSQPMGPDGCFDADHPSNIGLTTIWCADCPLTLLYKQKYSYISKADFWVAAANAVIRQTSSNALDLKRTFLWGRKDAASCLGAGSRMPKPTGCNFVEDVFVKRMGLTWRDAVVLMGAHALGRSNAEFSGHEGLWKDSEEEAQKFDKKYFDEMFTNSWRPRNFDQPNQDWTTGSSEDTITRLMLNTDLCLFLDIDNVKTTPCCAGEECVETAEPLPKCPMLTSAHPRYEAFQTVEEMLGGDLPNSNDGPFFDAYTESWNKATTMGRLNLTPLKESCP